MVNVQEADILKETFKRLKQKTADLNEVLDTRCPSCCRNLVLQEQKLRTSPSNPSVSLRFLSSPSSWTVYTHPDYPGLLLLKGAFSSAGLADLLTRVLLDYPGGSEQDTDHSGDHVRSNLSCLETTYPDGKSYWSTVDDKGNPLISKLRWVSTGYHFDWTKREYRKGFKSPFPEELESVGRNVIERLSVCNDLKPDSAIVNYYHPGDTLSFHQDELEWDLSKPLVSISLGLPGILCVGRATRSDPPLPLLLTHGDIVILSGPSRLAFHAVPKVFDSYNVRTCRHETDTGFESKDDVVREGSSNIPGWIDQFVDGLPSDTLQKTDQSLAEGQLRERIRNFLPRTRINISIRQVEKYD